MPGNDLDLLVEAARRAGAEARRRLDEPLKVRRKPGDDSPVTQVDFAVDRLLRAHLTAARPDYGWLSEETEDDGRRLGADRVFIVDPIDGTRALVDGQTTWAHSLAVADRGRVVAAVVFLPLKDRMYTAAEGGGARLNGAPIQVGRRAALDGATVLANRPSLEPCNWPGGVPVVDRVHRPSLAYRLCIVAQGRFDAALTLRPAWEWDIAAGSLILAEAGARVSDRRGGPLRFNAAHPQADGLVGANTTLHAELLDRLM